MIYFLILCLLSDSAFSMEYLPVDDIEQFFLRDVVLPTDYDVSHLKCRNLDGIIRKYSWEDLDKYCGFLKIKKTKLIINKIRAAGEYYLINEDLKNFKTILSILYNANASLRTEKRYLDMMRESQDINISYREFFKQIHAIGRTYFDELIVLYGKKKGKPKKLLDEVLSSSPYKNWPQS